VIVVLVAAALLASQTLFGQGKARSTSPWTLTILHTADVEGYLDPCG
jgi:2',3'-cyclic-nucleotide 2'-phosphodiesterase (5'-nucleotidase family)